MSDFSQLQFRIRQSQDHLPLSFLFACRFNEGAIILVMARNRQGDEITLNDIKLHPLGTYPKVRYGHGRECDPHPASREPRSKPGLLPPGAWIFSRLGNGRNDLRVARWQVNNVVRRRAGRPRRGSGSGSTMLMFFSPSSRRETHASKAHPRISRGPTSSR
jgi:hypothetical protein